MSGLLRALIVTGAAAFGLFDYAAAAQLPGSAEEAVLDQPEKRAFVEALKPRQAGRPVIAIIALNEGTEMTDLLLPHAVLKRADVANVRVVAPRAGRVNLYPALQIDGVQDFAHFDRDHPAGPDYIIVPAMEPDDDSAVTEWLGKHAKQGARVIGICSGVRVLGQAGLLDGRRFTGHWYDRSTLLEYPGAEYVPRQRYVADRDVATTTGISASVPATLALVEAIGGHEKARAMATEIGVDSWGPEHDSDRFGLSLGRAWSYVLDKAAVWRDEDRVVDVRDGMDDIALALAADAWSRTGHVSLQAASDSGPVTLRSGLTLLAQPADKKLPRLPIYAGLTPMEQLDRALGQIAERYGPKRRDWVMQEMEYAGSNNEPPLIKHQ